MKFRFDIQGKGSYLHVSCRGDLEIGGLKDMFQAAIVAATQHHLQKVFIDGRLLTGDLSDAERYYLGVFVSSLLGEHETPFSIRMGILGNETVVGSPKFGEIVARSRGASGQVATDLDEILEWLEITRGQLDSEE